MRTLPVRFWLWLLLIAVVTVPAATTLAIVVSWPPPSPAEWWVDQTLSPTLEETLRNEVDDWDDPTWQAALEARLASAGLAAMLTDEAGRVVYRSPGWPSAEASAATMIVPADAGAVVVLVTAPSASRSLLKRPWVDAAFWRIPLAQMAALLLIAAGIALFVHRAFLWPLSQMVEAMRHIGAGNLDTRLPHSRVSEVDEVATAFGTMAKDLRLSLERQAALEQERRMTIGALVHDLRTPLFSLRGYLEGLATGLADTPEKTARYICVCQEKADALERLVGDLFEYTRTEYLEEVPRAEPLNLGDLLHRTSEGLLPQAEAKGVHLVLDDAADPVMVAGDPMLLMRAVENVLDNAVRHTPTGGEVRIVLRQDARDATFTITDTGPGIAPADLPHLFTPFYRGEESRNRRTGGTGLGLAIARRLMRVHGGNLTAGVARTGGALITGSLPALSISVVPLMPDTQSGVVAQENPGPSFSSRAGVETPTAPALRQQAPDSHRAPRS